MFDFMIFTSREADITQLDRRRADYPCICACVFIRISEYYMRVCVCVCNALVP